MAQKYGVAPEKLYDPNEAKAIHKLLIQQIQNRIDTVKNLKETELKKLDVSNPGLNRKDAFKLLRKNDYNLYRTIRDLPNEHKALRRGLAELLTTDSKFFDQKGVLDLFSKDISKLKGQELYKTLKGWDNNFSGYKSKTGKVGHHTTLSALTDVLSKVDEPWRNKFNQLASEEGFKIGDRGLIEIAPGVHKPFDTKASDPQTKLVKGQLAEKLAPLMPDNVFKDGRLEIKRGVNPKVDKMLEELENISTHGAWAGGTRGFDVSAELAKLTPEQAFERARTVLGAEGAQAQHGTKIDKLLEDHLNKSNFQNIDEAAESLSSKFKQPNWQPPDLKGYIEKDSSKVLPKISEDVLDQPSTVRGLDVNKMKIGGGLRTADSLAQIASGNVIGGGASLALQQEPVQKQIAKLLAKRAAKTSAKLVPGVDVGLSAAEAAQYFASGNYIQGGIASLSGAVGWIPGVGDAASAALDLANTGMDINKLKAQGITNRHKKIDADRFDLSLKGFKSI
tara:strand:- start:499 stop:2016 length:1518 start_codon:yes stop_codon:yes gene_type:complete